MSLGPDTFPHRDLREDEDTAIRALMGGGQRLNPTAVNVFLEAYGRSPLHRNRRLAGLMGVVLGQTLINVEPEASTSTLQAFTTGVLTCAAVSNKLHDTLVLPVTDSAIDTVAGMPLFDRMMGGIEAVRERTRFRNLLDDMVLAQGYPTRQSEAAQIGAGALRLVLEESAHDTTVESSMAALDSELEAILRGSK